MVREIGWTHNSILLMNCKDDLEREFYIRMTRKFGWTKNILALGLIRRAYFFLKLVLHPENAHGWVRETI